ncbi:MAG: T9SS type A sorting domain-containing protein, partial [Bacteroidota bacterium]
LNTKKVDKTIDISKIHLLELNKTELNRLGVVSKTSSIKVPISWKNGQDFIEYTDKGSSATFNTLSQKEYYDLPLEERGDSAQIYFNDKNESQYVYFKKSSVYFILPIIVTDIKGKHAYLLNDNQRYELHDTDFEYMRKYEIDTATYYFTNQYREYAKKCLRSRMQTFVPILVKSSDEQLQMILWYEPTNSFFASLPKPIADEIKSEYTAIKANQPTPSCKYFEVCQSVKGMINEYSVYPNPTNNEINVLIDLAEERKLTISLTDISGKIVKNFVKDLLQSKGKKEYPFQIGEVSEGMYLLLIETDKGERVTQRIIKK